MKTLEELAAVAGARLDGDGSREIDRVDTLVDATAGAISFLASGSFRKHLAATRASAVILNADDRPGCPTDALVTPNPHVAYARVAAALNPEPEAAAGVHATAFVDPGAEVDPTAVVGPFAYVGGGARIGPGTRIGPHCVLDGDLVIGADCRLVASVSLVGRVRMGNRCRIHPGVVIGSDGFGLANEDAVWVKVPQLGGVVVGDDVEVGANTTIDRGAIRDTIIADGVKLDNQIQVAHNVEIGKHTAMAAFVGVSGSTKIGSHCTVGGQSGFAGHLEIADQVHLTGATAVHGDIAAPGVYSGIPAIPNDIWRKSTVRFKQLDSMARRLRTLEKRLEDLESES